jgi:hypothetical protein
MARNLIARTITIADTDTDQAMVSATATEPSFVGAVDITAHEDNTSAITIKGDGENEYDLEAGESRVLDGVDLTKVTLNGTADDVLKVIGNTV